MHHHRVASPGPTWLQPSTSIRTHHQHATTTAWRSVAPRRAAGQRIPRAKPVRVAEAEKARTSFEPTVISETTDVTPASPASPVKPPAATVNDLVKQEDEERPEALRSVDILPDPPADASASGSSMDGGSGFSTTEPSASNPSTSTSNGSTSTQQQPNFASDLASWFGGNADLMTLSYAVLTGVVVAGSVFVFDVSIQYIHDLPDALSQNFQLGGGRATGLELFGTAIPFRCVMPVGAGFVVAFLQSKGFSPALRFLTRAIEGVVDDKKKASLPTSYGQVFRKAAASAVTLGSGASLGPEAPSVELGANTAAILAPKSLNRRRQRMLVAAGAAAGVSAAFDAPVAGALFAVEFVLKSSRLGLDRLSTSTVFVATSVAAGVIGSLRDWGQSVGVSGAAAHLVGRIPYFSVQNNPLLDVVEFGLLGLGCAAVATSLYEGVRFSELLLRPLPRYVAAPLGGALCGLVALNFPQVQYGYVNLEEIFRDSVQLPLNSLIGLLFAKIIATSVCAGGGLVGGLFAPSLFLGAIVGDIFGETLGVSWGTDSTTLVVVGAAAVLGAACRAPLTSIALMVEITRDVGLLVPLLAAIGTASLVTEYLEGIFTTKLEAELAELYLKEQQLFWPLLSQAKPEEAPSSSTVEQIMSTSATLYVRHTLPLEQAKVAMESKGSQAAVVVDDKFNPKGLVYLADVEAELVRRDLLCRDTDGNFDRQV